MNPGICIDGRYIQDHYPGIGRYTYDLIDALAQAAPNSRFRLLHNPALVNTRFEVAALARYPNIDIVRTNIPTRSLREQFRLPLSECQVFHSPYFFKPYLIRRSTVVSIFDLIPLRAPQMGSVAARWLIRTAIAAAARTSTRVIVPSAWTRNDLIAALQIPPEKIAVIPLAADSRFTPASQAETKRIRTEYGIPEKYLLYVGINKPHKNLGRLISAWERARVDAGLVIAGEWDVRYESSFREHAANVRFLHGVAEQDLPSLYSGANVFVFPSLYEGFGLPLLEAMACGAPVISSNASSLPEIGGEAALYFDPQETDALAQMIARVIGDAGLQEEMRGRSLARARSFSWERTALQTLGVYGSAINKQILLPNSN